MFNINLDKQHCSLLKNKKQKKKTMTLGGFMVLTGWFELVLVGLRWCLLV